MKFIKNKSFFKTLVLILFISNNTLSYSQKINHQAIDSVLALVHKQETDSLKISLNRLGYNIVREAPKEAQSYFEYLFKKDSTAIVKLMVYEFYAKNLASLGLTDQALILRKEGLVLSEKFKDITHIIYYNIAIADCYTSQNKLDKSLKFLNKAEKLAIKTNTLYLLSDVYIGKTRTYTVLEDYEKTFEYYQKIWEIIKNEKNTPSKRFHLYSVVDFLSQVDKPKELVFFTEELAKLYNDVTVKLPKGHYPIKGIYERIIDPEKIPRYKEIVRVSDSLISFTTLYYSAELLAKSYQANQQSQEGIGYLKKTISKFESVDRPSQLMNLYALLSKMFVDTNNYKEAFKAKELEYKLRDKISSGKMQTNISELEIKYDTEKKEREILQQKTTIQKKNSQRNLMIFGIIALGILFLVSTLFFRNKLKLQKQLTIQNEAIQKQKIKELNQQNKLFALNSMIEGQEAERLRIAKDLHDSLGGLLSTVKTHFNIIQTEIKQLEELNITQKTNDLIDEACIEVRRISHNMMPHALSISGLEGAIEDLGERLSEEGYQTTVEIKNLAPKIDETKKAMMYRLVQEIISNIKKHADAKTILIQLIGHKDGINIMIEDDGKGFDYLKALQKDGLGLKSINSRVEFLDGKIDWDSQINKGTSIIINVPLK